MNLRLKDKVILITGGSKGIGREITKTLIKEKAIVYCLARESKELDSIKLKYSGNIIDCDATKIEQVNDSLKYITKKEGSLDVLINNLGGVSKFDSFENLSEEDWLDSYEKNILFAIRFIKASLPLLKESRFSKILNISSTVSVKPGLFNPHYSAMKAALNNLSVHLAKKYAQENILVNSLLLGPVMTPSFEENMKYNWKEKEDYELFREEFIKFEESKILLKKLGSPKEIAFYVAILISPRTSWLTGSDVNLDGGKFL